MSKKLEKIKAICWNNFQNQRKRVSLFFQILYLLTYKTEICLEYFCIKMVIVSSCNEEDKMHKFAARWRRL
jgi:hypothetical protein